MLPLERLCEEVRLKSGCVSSVLSSFLPIMCTELGPGLSKFLADHQWYTILLWYTHFVQYMMPWFNGCM
jgi:hypothetical protein